MPFHMQFGNALEPYTQANLANINDIAQSTWSKYMSGKLNIPDQVALNTVQVLKNPRAGAVFTSAKKTDAVNPVLPNNVNEDPYVILDVLIEEAEELVAAAIKLKKMIRSRKNFNLTREEREHMYAYEEQILDILPAVKMHFIRMKEVYGLDILRVEEDQKIKMRRKKHYRDGVTK